MPSNTATTEYPLGDAAQGAVDFIDAQIPAIDVVSVMLNQRTKDNGDLYDVFDIGFRIPPANDVFFCHPDANKDWQKLALHEITLKADKVLSIYAGFPYRQDVIPLINPLPSDYADDPNPPVIPPSN